MSGAHLMGVSKSQLQSSLESRCVREISQIFCEIRLWIFFVSVFRHPKSNFLKHRLINRQGRWFLILAGISRREKSLSISCRIFSAKNKVHWSSHSGGFRNLVNLIRKKIDHGRNSTKKLIPQEKKLLICIIYLFLTYFELFNI